MKPYYVIRIDGGSIREQVLRHERREFFTEYDEDQSATEGLQSGTAVFGVNTPEDADSLLGWLTHRYPENSYMVVKSVKAGYREPGPLRFGVFTDEGFMPA